MIKLLFAFVLTITGWSAAAEVKFRAANEIEAAVIRNPAKKLLMMAMNNGLQQIDGMSLKGILDQIPSVKVGIARTEVENRATALWMPGKCDANNRCTAPTVVYNPNEFPKFSEDVRDVLAVHEFWGAISGGWKDDGYSRALYIYLVANKIVYKELLNIFVWPERSARPLLEARGRGGGSTTVGGGGDGRDVQMKLTALMFLWDYVKTGTTVLSGIKAAQVSTAELTRGVLFVNWYAVQTPNGGDIECHFPVDQSIEATCMIRPDIYPLMVANEGAAVIAVLKMGQNYAQKRAR